jgi:hypothetical protein
VLALGQQAGEKRTCSLLSLLSCKVGDNVVVPSNPSLYLEKFTQTINCSLALEDSGGCKGYAYIGGRGSCEKGECFHKLSCE